MEFVICFFICTGVVALACVAFFIFWVRANALIENARGQYLTKQLEKIEHMTRRRFSLPVIRTCSDCSHFDVPGMRLLDQLNPDDTTSCEGAKIKPLMPKCRLADEDLEYKNPAQTPPHWCPLRNESES